MKKEITIKIGGMMCEHCKNYVTNLLEGIDDVKKVIVDLPKKTATIYYENDLNIKEVEDLINQNDYEYLGIIDNEE